MSENKAFNQIKKKWHSADSVSIRDGERKREKVTLSVKRHTPNIC